jgi:predicted transcriptional regulator of viral defense system
MQFIDFKENLKSFMIFNLSDIRKIEADFDLRRLSEWQTKGYIKMIRSGYYIFSDLELNESVLFLIANKIYSPSYISFEMAFSHYGLIPEAVYGITSVASQKTNRFKTDFGEFIYRRLKPELMFGYLLIECQDHHFKMAEIEKALLDYFYINAHLKSENDFFEMRFNSEEFKRKADKEKIYRYLEAFNNKSLARRVAKFLKYIAYA